MEVLVRRRRNTPEEEVIPIQIDEADYAALGGRSLSFGSHGYVQIFADGRVQLLHRWLLGLGIRDGKIGNHVNGDPLDYRRANLRVVTASGSSANVVGRGVSGFRGVYPMRNKWQARGKYRGRTVNLGTHATPEEAFEVARAWRIENLPGYVDR